MSQPDSILTKRNQREKLIVEIGFSTASYFSNIAERSDGIKDGVVFVASNPILQSVLDAYFNIRVPAFKLRHGFGENDRINNSKIAALLVREFISKNVDDLFKLKPPVDSVEKRKLVCGDFLYRLFLDILIVKPDSLLQAFPKDDVRSMIKKDLRLCLTQKLDASDEWLSWAALVLCSTCGTSFDAIA